MNLITCAEDCEYQEDGYCQLEAGAPVSGVRVGGCCYFRQRDRKPREQQDGPREKENRSS